MPSICGVNDVASRRTYAEPWRRTRLAAFGCDANAYHPDVCWDISYIPREARLHPIPPRMTDVEAHYEACGAATRDHIFAHPGDYRACATAGNETRCTVIQNRYVHRHVMDLTQPEFDQFASAFQTMRRLSTEAGRNAYGHQCLDHDEDFFTHDAFVALHNFLSSFREHDRLHYIELQEPAHLAWTMRMQKALRCICPSCSHVYFDALRDYDEHYVAGQPESLLQSPVWSDTRYGGAGNHATTTESSSYAVTDGRFKNFPITQTQNASYWCDPLVQLAGSAVYDVCVEVMQTRLAAYRTGITLLQPRAVSDLQLVSRRPYYHLGRGDYCPTYINTYLRNSKAIVERASTLADVWREVSTTVHSFGHTCISGKWMVDEAAEAAAPAYSVAFGNDKAVNVGLWFNSGSVDHPCFQCDDNRCQCVPGSACASAERWYYKYPDDSSGTGGTYNRAEGFTLALLQSAGCNWPKSGTFDWSASANQDPAFYMHHFYTFYMNDLGYKRLKSQNVNILDMAEALSARDRPGNRLNDVTHFKNLIPYAAGQEVGSFHTWREILAYQISYEDFVFE